MGLASFFAFECDSCAMGFEMYSSPHCKDSRSFELNSRSVLGMLEVGAGKGGLEKFCAFLKMPNAITDEAYKNNLKK